MVSAQSAPSGGAHSLREWSLAATARGAAVGLLAGVAGGSVSLVASRVLEGRANGSVAATWLVGGAIAGALLGSAPRQDATLSTTINTTFLIGSVVAGAVVAPSVGRAAHLFAARNARQAGRELFHAGLSGMSAFGATAAAAAVAVPLGVPQHFDVTRR